MRSANGYMCLWNEQEGFVHRCDSWFIFSSRHIWHPTHSDNSYHNCVSDWCVQSWLFCEACQPNLTTAAYVEHSESSIVRVQQLGQWSCYVQMVKLLATNLSHAGETKLLCVCKNILCNFFYWEPSNVSICGLVGSWMVEKNCPAELIKYPETECNHAKRLCTMN